ncbi:uncharacterized protein LOC143197893 [Rhynchophorus ferrugineus]|uniref:uncharacterized protein LOC143197893 n=1 Tax=Rhynchophorus ferrugineus TaxID=354439 RepID=UPI003FCD738E
MTNIAGLLVLFVTSYFLVIDAASTSTTAAPKCALFHDILKVIPADKVKEIENNHLKNDEGFRAAISYLQSSNWTDLVGQVLKTPEYKEFEKMAAKYKINVDDLLKNIRSFITSIKIEGKTTAAPNLKPFFKDIENIIPIFEITKSLSAQLNNPEFVKIRSDIASKENQKIAENLHNIPQMIKLREILKQMNFDVEPYIALIYAFLGWTHP